MYRDIVKSEKYKGYTINIEYDTDPENPRSWDNIASMYTWHRRSTIGDKHDYSSSEDLLMTLADVDPYDQAEYTAQELLDKIRERGTVIAPVYLYEHSGMTISTSSFGDRWDSGCIGWIFVEADTIENEWGSGPDAHVKAAQLIKSEVETYDQWLRGEIYTWSVEETGECTCGYYSVEEAIAEAKDNIDWYVKSIVKKHLQQLKRWIQNKVPHLYRKPLQII